MTKPHTIHIISWDWKDQLDIDDLDRYVYDISATGRPVRIKMVDTGSDQFAITISDVELDDDSALAAYEKWCDEL